MSYAGIYTRQFYLSLIKDEEPNLSTFMLVLRRITAITMIAAPYIGAYCAYYFGFRWIANYLYVEYILIFVFSSAGYVVFAYYDPLWRWVSTWLYLVP